VRRAVFVTEDRDKRCPFRVGESVVYRPSDRGLGLEVMALPSQRLTLGKTYRIREIQKECYVVVEGYDHPGGGLYWTEFEKVD